MKKSANRKIVMIASIIVLVVLGIMLFGFFKNGSILGFAVYEISDFNPGFASISNYVPYNSLVAYYPFDFSSPDGTAALDYSASPKNAAYVGGMGLVSSGVYLNCSSFDGADDYLRVPSLDSNSLDLTQDFSASIWIKTNSYRGLIFSKSEPNAWSGCNQVFFVESDKTLEFQSWGAGIVNSVGTVNVGSWTHIAITYKRSTNNVSFYINGQLDNSGTLSSSSCNSQTSVFRIGTYGTPGNLNNFNGKMDEFMLFSSTLTSQEVNEIYNTQSDRFNVKSLESGNIAISSGVNKVNLTINKIAPADASMRLGLSYYNGSWVDAGTQNVGSINTFDISENANIIKINLTLYPDTSKFFTPVVYGNINVVSWYVAPPPVVPQTMILDYVSGAETDNSYINKNNISVNVNYSNNKPGSLTLSIRLYNSTNLVNTTSISLPSSSGNAIINFFNLNEGIYRFNSTISDGTITNSTGTRTVTIDRTIPSLRVYSPENATSYLIDNYFINVSLSEPGLCSFSINNGTSNTSMGDLGDSWFAKNRTGISNGNYSLVVYCRDLAGNTNYSSFIRFQIAAAEEEVIMNLTSGAETRIEEQLINIGFSKIMNVGDSILFNMNGNHTLKVREFNNATGIVSLLLSNPSFAFTIALGATKELDFNSDGKNDLSVKFDSLSDNKPQFYIKKITYQLTQEIATPAPTKTIQDHSNAKTDVESDYVVWVKNNWKVLVLSALVVIILVVTIWWTVRYVKGRKVRVYRQDQPLERIIDRKLGDLMKEIRR